MEKRSKNKGIEWCPEADLNHRHADFQSRAIHGCSIACSGKAVKPKIEDQTLSGDLSNSSNAIHEAAGWLSVHREACVGRIIPTLKHRFGLSAIEAIEAAKRAHALQYGGASHG